MINFFRKTRNKLITENKFSKYLLYAIGEIVLVVIGILIALQINNWSERRKATEKEIVLLKNIRKDINLDTIDLKGNYKYHKKFYEAEQAFFNLLISEGKKQVTEDSINYSDVLGVPLWTALHKSTFTNLQNNDVDLLKNNEIRKELSRFYDYYQQAIEYMANHFEEFNLYRRKLPYFKKYFRVIPTSYKILDIQGQPDVFEHNLSKNEIVLYDLEGAKKDHAFIFTLNEVIFFRRAFVDFHEAILVEISSLNDRIDKEIQKLEKSL